MTENQTPEGGLDEVERRDYAALIDSVADVLDVRGGLADTVDIAHYTALSSHIASLLDVEAGLRSALRTMRANLFAQRWAKAIAGTSYVSMGRRMLAQYVLGLTQRLVDAALAVEFDQLAGRQVGIDMVTAHFTGTETLSKTLALIIQELPNLLSSASPNVNISNRLAQLVGALAGGYASALRQRGLDEQEAVYLAELGACRRAEQPLPTAAQSGPDCIGQGTVSATHVATPPSAATVDDQGPHARIRRPSVDELLARAAMRRICVVIGAAGWGKTTAVATWSRSRSTVWLRYEDYDGDAHRLLNSLFKELTVHATAASPIDDPAAMGADRAASSVAAICRWLRSALTEDIFLVLDDLQELRPDSHAAGIIQNLCRRAPDRLHLILISRCELPFSVERLRGRGLVMEIHAPDLAFEATDVEAILRKTVGQDPPGLSRQAWKYAGGWPAAVHCMVEMLRSTEVDQRLTTIEALSQPGQRFHDYLAEEIVGAAPERVQQLLRRLAILGEVRVPTEIAPAAVLVELTRQGLVRRTDGPGWALIPPLLEFFRHEAASSSDDVHSGPAIFIQTLGVFRVIRDGFPIPNSEWKSKKARDLLKILVARRRPTPRDQLIELLWPDANPATSSNRLSVLLSTVREVLQPQPVGEGPLVTTGGAVSLNPAQVGVDVEDFLTQATAALEADRAKEPDATARLITAVTAHTGDFLEEDPHQEWAATLAEEVLATHIALLRALVTRLRDARDTDAVVRYTLRLLQLDCYDEEAHRGLVAILLDAGHLGQARRHYQNYVRRMAEIGVRPRPPSDMHLPVLTVESQAPATGRRR